MHKLYKLPLLFAFGFSFSGQLMAQQTEITNLSGDYESPSGSLKVAIVNNTITGKYEYLDKYDQQLHVYMRQNIFTFYGKSVDGTHFDIIAIPAESPEQRAKGTIIFFDKKLKILMFDDVVSASFDLTHNGKENIFPIKRYVPYIAITYVKLKKTLLYDFDGNNFIPRKGYLVKGDEVMVLSIQGEYEKIVYKSPVRNGKPHEYWVKQEDLYSRDPETWKN
jgi:hypothetical protein